MNNITNLHNNIYITMDNIEDIQKELFDLLKKNNNEINYLKFKNKILEKQLFKLKKYILMEYNNISV